MSTRFSTRWDVGSSAEATGSAITSERWPEAIARELHDDSRVLSREQTPSGGVQLAHSRELPDGVPGFLLKFLPKDGRVTQTDIWDAPGSDGSRQGRWQVTLAGAPAELSGTQSVLTDGDGCVWAIEGTVKVSVPVIGGKIESYLAEMLEKLTKHQAVVLRHLAAEPR